MSFICGLKADKKILIGIVILFGIILYCISTCGCGVPDDIFSTKAADRAHVKKCRVFYNWGISDSDFMKHVHWMVEDTDWIDIRVIRWTGAVRKRGSIVTVVVYYE